MSTTREGVQLASLDGAVYAVGGDNGVSILNTVERYDPRIDQWSVCVPMSYRRRYFGASVLKNKIYVVGGSDYDEDHNSVECYDPRMNRWLSLPPLLMRRESPAAAVHDDKLYALGGAYMNSESNTVDVYDPLTNKWEAFTPLTRAIEGMGVVVVWLVVLVRYTITMLVNSPRDSFRDCPSSCKCTTPQIIFCTTAM